MEIIELKTFLSVAKHQSFSLASKALFLTQPAISKRIASLEKKLDVPLFDRIGHQVHLTEYGKALQPRAEKLILEIEDISRSLKNISNKVSGKLSIGASHHIGLRRLPPHLKRYTKKYPDVNLDISFLDSEKAHDAVLSGEIELAVVTLPKVIKPQLKATEIWKDKLHIVVAKDHPIASKKAVKLKDLSAFQAILPSKVTFTRTIIEETFAAENIPINISINTNYIETIQMMVSIGLGWSALPETMITEDLEIISIPKLNIQRSLGCIHHADRTLSNAASAMLKQLTFD